MNDSTDKTLHIKQADFARRRGVSRATVTEYKHKGLLVMTQDGLVDVAASEALLASNLEPLRGGNRSAPAAKKPAADTSAFMTAKTREMEAKAARQEMDTKQRAGELVERASVERVGFTLARNAQDAMMAIADRLAPLLAAEGDSAKVHEMLSDELRRVCQALAKAAREPIE